MGYEYRIDGPRTKMTDGTGATTYTYDAAGRLLTQSSPLTGKTLTSHYIAGTNRRDTLSGGSQTWTSNYDAGLRLDHVDQTVGAASGARFEYYASGAVRYRHAGTLSRVWYDVDPRGRVRQIDHRAGPVASERTAQSAVYGYGPDGNTSAYIEWVADTNSYRHDYVHDRADRLTSEVRAPLNGPGLSFSNQYEYDKQGNRAKVTRGGTAYAYGAPGLNDEFTTGEGFAFYSYDGDGNPGYVTGPNGLAMAFSYDEMGRVLQISGTGASTFRYDGDGRRVERAAGGATTRFAYDGDQAVLETDGGNAVTTYRLPGAGFVSGGSQYYEQESLQGSVLSTRDASAALKSHTQYDAYGVEYGPWESTPGALGVQRFAGQKGYQNDLATGMQLLGARYYLPVLGRFLTPDPIGHEGGLNLYAYCGDSPLLRSDPSGTFPRDSVRAYILNIWRTYKSIRDVKDALDTIIENSTEPLKVARAQKAKDFFSKYEDTFAKAQEMVEYLRTANVRQTARSRGSATTTTSSRAKATTSSSTCTRRMGRGIRIASSMIRRVVVRG